MKRQFLFLSHRTILLALFCLCSYGLSIQAAERSPAARKSAATSTGKIDINTASKAELESLPGIGPATAGEIIAARPFKSINDLKNVSGIGEARFDQLRNQVTVSAVRSRSAASRSTDNRAAKRSATAGSERPSRGAAPQTGLTDINTADAAALEALPGIGPETARNIIAARPFSSLDQLKDVRGIGEARFEQLRPHVTVRRAPGRAPRSSAGSPAGSNRGANREISEPAPERTPEPGAAGKAIPQQGKININTASKEELESLLGIGPVKAQAIIDHRPYKSIDEVMEVKGIKEGTFEQIRGHITVR